jgi:hypothetical protein
LDFRHKFEANLIKIDINIINLKNNVQMKSFNSIRKYGLALLAMMVMLTAANAQSRYKHVPRVKVDKKYTEKVTIKEKKSTATATTASYVNVEETNTVAETPVVTENTTVASNNQEVVVANHKTKSVVKHHPVIKTNKKANHDAFTKKAKDNSKLMDVKDVKKSALEKWVLIMIILYAVGIVFLILAFVFLFALYSYALYYVFLIIGVLCLLAASIILPLGLAGVI